MKKSNEKFTILYARLSQEDGRDGVSNSIENQKMILEKYAADNGFENCKFVFDDGVSGTHFNRKGWNEVMELIQNNQVANLIIKDTSRLGRNYRILGELMEDVFPNYGVRFISIGDGADSLYGLDDFMPFRNIFLEMYAKDCSKKVRAVKKAQAEKGERTGAKAPYGYKKSASNPKKLELDEVAADVVKRIFQLCIEGKGPSQIAKQLQKEQVVNPSNYYFRTTGAALSNLDTENPYGWRESTVATILEDEVYLGHTISMKKTTKSYKNKKIVERPKEEWLRFENTHQAIISQDDWDIVQKVRQAKRRPQKFADSPNIFSGLVVCADCGGNMVLHRAHTMDKKKNNFACSTYKRKGKDKCSMHFIREAQLAAIILDDLKRVTHFARLRSDEFAELIARKSTAETRKQIAKCTHEIDILRKRNKELDSIFKKLFESHVIGEMPNEMYRKLRDEYLAEQKDNQNRLPELEDQLEKLKSSLTNADKFIEKANKYIDFVELSGDLLRNFIDKVVVYERDEKGSSVANQKVEIYYLDIGYLGDYTAKTDIEKPHYDFMVLASGEMVARDGEQDIA